MINLFKNKKSFGIQNRIYFDSASAVPVSEIGKKSFLDTLEKTFANSSSIHFEGEKAKEILFEARKKIAKVLKAKSSEIYFCSSTTEANNIFIKGLALANFSTDYSEERLSHIVFSMGDHSSLVKPVLDSLVFATTLSNVGPNEKGILEVDKILSWLRSNTKLICFSYVNSETGSIQNVRKIVLAVREFCKNKNWEVPKIFIDATQAVLYENLDVSTLLVDGMSFGGGKIGSVPGASVLYIRNGVKIKPIISGGGQEEEIRSGTENLPAIVSLAEVLSSVKNSSSNSKEYVYSLRNYAIEKLKENFSENELEIFGDTKFKYNKFFENSAPHILLISLVDMLGEETLLRLDAKGISVSTASACSLLENSGSSFLRAIGEPVKSKETVRLSFSDKNTKEEIDYFVKVLREIKDKFIK